MQEHTIFDWSRRQRTGVPEAVYAENKSLQQLRDILTAHQERGEPVLFTRLTDSQADALAAADVVVNRDARTGTYRVPAVPNEAPCVAIVAAGTSDLPVAMEAEVAANFFGLRTTLHVDVGVAGLWRLERVLPTLREADLIIAVAGMEGALFSVLAGLVPTAIIAVPTSVGYGVSEGGKAALASALSSCAPGIVTVNIDNGLGAAAAARKILGVRTQNAAPRVHRTGDETG
ncbi:MAG: nickel pincer cofactor biosynthesis protein LarB [Pseudomonadota bacterium]